MCGVNCRGPPYVGMFISNAYWRVPVSSSAPLPSLHMPAIVRLCSRFTIRTTANMLTCASAPEMFRSPVSAYGILKYCVPFSSAA